MDSDALRAPSAYVARPQREIVSYELPHEYGDNVLEKALNHATANPTADRPG